MNDNAGLNAASALDDEKFELSPEEATGLGGGKPAVINRKRILVAVCVFFAVFVCGGLLLNTLKQKNKKENSDDGLYASNSSSSDFLDSLQNRALNNRRNAAPEPQAKPPETGAEDGPEPLLPQASFTGPRPADPARQPPPTSQTPQPQAPPPPQNQQQPTHFKSPLVPAVEGSLFSQWQAQYAQQPASAGTQARPAAEFPASAAADRASPTPAGSGFFIGENSIWTGTIIPGVLETAVNTDLPGAVIARVTQNVFDSKTGRSLLVPQGTLLLAKYNSSVSFAQRRVQIVWDAMIRPDGFQVDFDGAYGVDGAGMSGQAARYHENWFEYLKAAGIITLFSIANADMTEAAAKYATDAAAANIAEANSAFVNQVGGNFISRAMNIQPTLTVENGTPVNVMLNRTLYLPPVPAYPASQKYILE